MRDRYKIYDKDGIYFITMTIVAWLPVFTHQRYFDILIDSLKFCIDTKGLRLHSYVILENHTHFIVSGPNLAKTTAEFKKYTAKTIIQLAQQNQKNWLLNQFAFYKKKYKKESTHQVWQEGVHPKMIQSTEMLRQKMNYIHDNPVRRGYVDSPEHWRYSSARNYLKNDSTIIEVDKSLF